MCACVRKTRRRNATHGLDSHTVGELVGVRAKLAGTMRRINDRTGRARIIAAAAPLEAAMLQELVESAPYGGPFQAGLAR